MPAGPLAAILVFAFALQLGALSRVHGYPIADSVEYLERAKLFLAGQPLDPATMRSFSFSALLVPLVAVFGVFGDEVVLGAARLAMMMFGLATILVTAKTAAHLAGRGAGLVAAFALAVNPVFLQWSVEPLSGLAAAFFVALAILWSCERGGFRHGLLVGAALGAAFLMAFQSLAVIACVGGLLVLRDRWRGRAHLAGWAVAIALFLAIQATVDLAVYGAFGSSLVQYVKENFATTVGSLMYERGGGPGHWLSDRGIELYNWGIDAVSHANQVAGGALRSKQPRGWYVMHLHTHLYAVPMLVLLAAGVVKSLVRPRWAATILIATCALNVLAMSRKGSQSYRLWLPLLPMFSVLLALGWAWLTAPGLLRGRALRHVAALMLLALGAVQGASILRRTNLAKHGGYWDAMAFVADARERTGADHERLAAGYHWATLFRDGGDGLEQVKLPHALYAWPATEEERAPLRAAVVAELDTLDWFVSHVQPIEQDPAIAAALAARFEVVAAFHDGEVYEDLATILVLHRVAPDATDARRLFEIRRDADPGVVQSRIAHPRSIDLRRRFDGGVTDQLVLLGWDAEMLPGSDNVAWLTLSWYAGPTNGRDYTVNLRVTDADDRDRQVNRAPCWGAAPTSTWQTGWIVRDGLPIPLDAVPGPEGALLSPLGGANRRGDRMPLRVWLAAPRYEADAEGVLRAAGGLAPFQPSGLRPVHKERREGRMVSDEGWIFSADNLVLVGGFLAPVPAALHVADDGSPIPGAEGAGGG